MSETFHEMQLRRFGDGIGHAGAAQLSASDRGGDEEDAALGVGVKGVE